MKYYFSDYVAIDNDKNLVFDFFGFDREITFSDVKKYLGDLPKITMKNEQLMLVDCFGSCYYMVTQKMLDDLNQRQYKDLIVSNSYKQQLEIFIEKMTKKNRIMWENYKKSSDYHLRDVYKGYSLKKSEAWAGCIAKKHELNGFDGRITSYNTFQFSYAFEYVNLKKEKRLCYMTANNTYDFKIF